MSSKKYLHFEDEDGNKTMTAQVDGYSFGDRLLEGVMFDITIESDGSLSAKVEKNAESYFEDLNKDKWLKEAIKYAERNDCFGEDDEWVLVEDTSNNNTTQNTTQNSPTPIQIVAKSGSAMRKTFGAQASSGQNTVAAQANSLQAALGITQNQGASNNLQSNLNNAYSVMDEMSGSNTKTDERDDAIDKIRDVANTGLKLGKTSRGELAEIVLKLYNLDDLEDTIAGTRVVVVNRKKSSRLSGIEDYAIEEIIENCATVEDRYILLSNCEDETQPRKIFYSQMREDSGNGTAILKYEANEIGDLMDTHFLKYEVKPISKLMSLFEEDEQIENEIEVNDSHLSKLDSLFDEDEEDEKTNVDVIDIIMLSGDVEEVFNEKTEDADTKTVDVEQSNNSKLDDLLAGFDLTEEPKVEEVVAEVAVVEEAPISYAAKMIQESVDKMNSDKLAELQERIDEKKKEIKKCEYDAKLAEQRAKKATEDVDVLLSRYMQMQPKKASNGHSFSVGVMNEQTFEMEVVIAPTSKYDADTFKNTQLPASVKKELEELGLELQSVGLGESTWKQVGVTPELIEKAKAGEIVLKKSDFKMYHEMKIQLSKAGFDHDGSLDDYISREKDQLLSNSTTGLEEIDNETRQSMGLFDTLNGKAPFTDSDDTAVGPNTVMPFGNPYTTKPVNIQPTGSGMQVQKPTCTHQGCGCDDLTDTEANKFVAMEVENDFEEENGYPIGNEFIFSIFIEPTATNDISDPEAVISINPKSYWDMEGNQYDQHIESVVKSNYPHLNSMGMLLEEVEEGCFDMLDSVNLSTGKHLTTLDTIENLCKAGVKFERKYQDFMSQKDTQTVENMIIQLGYQHLII